MSPPWSRRAVAAGLAVDGLMTVGPDERRAGGGTTGVPGRAALVDELGLRTCSMGMTDDLEVAVAGGLDAGARRHRPVRPAA